MTTFTIQQVQGMQGMTIPRIEVKVAMVYDRKTGAGQHGEWSLQNGTIEDSTGKMKVLFKQLPDQSKLVGRTLIFKSMETKHGLRGVECKNNEYRGKTTIELHVSKAALIVGSQEEEDTVSQVEPSTRMPQKDVGEALEAVFTSKPTHEDRKLGIATAKNRLTQLAGLYDLCWETVGHMKVYEDTEGGMELHKDVATTLFIQASREGLACKMPIRTIDKFYGEGGQDHPKDVSQEHEKDEIPF